MAKKSALIFLMMFVNLSMSYADNAEDWPCIQRYTPELSPTVVWGLEAGISPIELDQKTLKQVIRLSTNLRKDIILVESTIAEYLRSRQHIPEIHNHLFYEIFEKIQSKRKKVLGGIFRYSAKQQKLALRIDKQRKLIDQEQSKEDINTTELEDLENRQMWDSRAFRERKQQLSYLCEKPVNLEQRLYFVAKALKRHQE